MNFITKRTRPDGIVDYYYFHSPYEYEHTLFIRKPGDDDRYYPVIDSISVPYHSWKSEVFSLYKSLKKASSLVPSYLDADKPPIQVIPDINDLITFAEADFESNYWGGYLPEDIDCKDIDDVIKVAIVYFAGVVETQKLLDKEI